MAIRKSKTQKFQTKLTVEEALIKCEDALNNGGFKAIKVNTSLRQLNADYKKFTVYGEIEITLFEVNNETEIHLKSNANADNIFALFSSPNGKIMKAFTTNF